MRIARFKTCKGDIQYGVWEDNGRIRLVAGDILDLWAVTDQCIDREEIAQILAPVCPPNIFAMGLNYRAHAAEGGVPEPDHPLIFIKATTTVIPTDHPILLPKPAPDAVDFEAELALIIGRKTREVNVEEAAGSILGYTAANDVSARDCQMKHDRQWARGKSFDTFCPLGPFICIGEDPDSASVRSRLNGEPMQDGHTSDLIFNCRYLVSYLSHQFTLLPGTIILTGTPSGVGVHRNPPIFLKDGDLIEVEVEGVGVLSNPIVCSP